VCLQRSPRPNSAGSSSGSLAKLGGLKISFKPKELAMTTEKGVSQQVCSALFSQFTFNRLLKIRAVLAKQPVSRNINSNNTRAPPKQNGVNLFRVQIK
jgi:hypothetical protein